MLLEWVAIGVGGIVAYTTMAGLTFRWWRERPGPEHEGYGPHCRYQCPGCEHEDNSWLVAGFWPFYWAAKVVHCLVIYPLVVAPFRLMAGTRRKDE